MKCRLNDLWDLWNWLLVGRDSIAAEKCRVKNLFWKLPNERKEICLRYRWSNPNYYPYINNENNENNEIVKEILWIVFGRDNKTKESMEFSLSLKLGANFGLVEVLLYDN